MVETKIIPNFYIDKCRVSYYSKQIYQYNYWSFDLYRTHILLALGFILLAIPETCLQMTQHNTKSREIWPFKQ